MCKKIAILELNNYHIEYLYTVAMITKMEDTEVTLIITEDTLSKVKILLGSEFYRYNIFIKYKNEGIIKFLRRTQNFLWKNKFDLLYINTLESYYIPFLFFNPRVEKSILTIHNINRWINPNIKLNNPKQLFKLMLRKLIFKRFKYINVLSEGLMEYCYKKNINKEVFNIPFSYYHNIDIPINSNTLLNDETLTFVVPGSIDERRRNYEIVLDAFEILFTEHSNIRLVILGRPIGKYGSEVIKKCSILKERGWLVSYFDEYIPEDVFESEIRRADFIIGPIRVNMLSDGINETYGVTKETGITFNIIKYGKAALLPKGFRIIGGLDKVSVKYGDRDELVFRIRELIENKSLRYKIKNEVKEKCQKFSLENIQQYFKVEILGIKS